MDLGSQVTGSNLHKAAEPAGESGQDALGSSGIHLKIEEVSIDTSSNQSAKERAPNKGSVEKQVDLAPCSLNERT